MAKEQNKKEIIKAFTKFFIDYNTRIVNLSETESKRSPRLNNNSKAIFFFVLGCHLRQDNFDPIVINNSRIQKGCNVSMSCRTIYTHIKLLIDAGILHKSPCVNKDYFMLCITEKLRNIQVQPMSDYEKKQTYTQLLTAYKSDIVKKDVRNIFPTSNISERYINKKRGVDKVEAKQAIEKIQSVGASTFSTQKNSFKDTEKSVTFDLEKSNELLNYPATPDYTGGRDFSFIEQFLKLLVPLLYSGLKDYQRSLIIKAILVFNTPKIQENAFRTIFKVHHYCKKNPGFRLHSPEVFFNQNNTNGFFTALNWPDFELENKKRNIEIQYVKKEVVYAKKLYYEQGYDLSKVIEQGKKLVEKYHNDPLKQKYIRKSLIPFINSKNNLYFNQKPK